MKIERWKENGRPKAVAFTGCCWFGSPEALYASDVHRVQWQEGRWVQMVGYPIFRYFRVADGNVRRCEHGAVASSRLGGMLDAQGARNAVRSSPERQEFEDFIRAPFG